MIGEQIKKLRAKEGMTQQNLADKLFVTAQAVSRWENGEVEPSLNTIAQMAKIFGVSSDEMLGLDPATEKTKEKENTKKETREETAEQPSPMLGLCERCHRPIYKQNEIYTYRTGRASVTHISCIQCEEKRRAQEAAAAKETAAKRRLRSYIWGGLGAALLLFFFIIGGLFKTPAYIPIGIITPIAAFTLISCLFLDNNFIWDVISWISTRSISMPGVIFSLDLDGIIWLITVKLGLFLLSAVISIALFLLAIALGLVLSIFVYPFALVKSIKHPEDDN